MTISAKQLSESGPRWFKLIPYSYDHSDRFVPLPVGNKIGTPVAFPETIGTGNDAFIVSRAIFVPTNEVLHWLYANTDGYDTDLLKKERLNDDRTGWDVTYMVGFEFKTTAEAAAFSARWVK